MKKLLYFFIPIIILSISCKKDNKDETIPKDPEPTKEIINLLVSGNNCTHFERLFKGYKMEELRSVKQTKDGGYIFCGATETIAENEYDILIIKTDCFGATEWMKTISNQYSDFGYDITLVSDGGYLVTANFSNDPDYYKIIYHQGQLIKLDETGNLVWKKNFNIGSSATVLNKAIETADGNFLVCGENSDNSFIFKMDAAGNITWIKYFTSNINLGDIAIHNDKNYIACGSITMNQQTAIYLVEMNVAGDTLWTNSINKNIAGGASSIEIVSNNEIAISGTYRTSNTTFQGFAMRLDATGKEIWYKSLEAEGIESLVKIVGTSGNNIVGVGSKAGALTIVKLDSNNGSIIWMIDKSSNTLIRDFNLCDDGGFIIVGSLFQDIGNRDGYVLKTDENGN